MKEVVVKLLDWFEGAKRPLPWRQNYEPYQVLVSELMLQQTQVKTMLPYFDRWMKALPDLASLATVTDETLLKLWEGLGYYSRALNLRRTAQILIEEHQGQFPHSAEALIKLPGIGPYTAAAISSIAFQKDSVVLDGNVQRVLSRAYSFVEDPNTVQGKKILKAFAEKLLPKGMAREFNQAMMELGALVCTPKKPLCHACPLAKDCLARKNGNQEELPKKLKRTELVPIQVVIGILTYKNKFFVQKRPKGALMPGLWEFPGGKIEEGESSEAALIRELEEELGIQVQNLDFFMSLNHRYTKFKVDLRAYFVKDPHQMKKIKTQAEFKWLSLEELTSLPFPKANVRLLEALKQL